MKNTTFYFSFCFLFLFGFLDLAAQNNLIPQPSYIKLGKLQLDLSKGIQLAKNTVKFDTELNYFLPFLRSSGISISTNKQLPTLSIALTSKNELLKNEEAYQIFVNSKGINIHAVSAKGVFYAFQTLQQFELKNKQIQYCNIQDSPAFSWRGFLVDVGRNFQPIEMLKEQIDVMAKFKLNVFHFHFTEDIAWRLESKKYPGLTAASNMTRWKGEYYTINEIKDLIKYCQQRYILFLPEIDMPGHSAAFKRFFGVDMQRDSGMVFIKELLTEFRNNFPELNYLHIGGDEVKIINKDFMPQITDFVEQLGFKTTLGWSPGSNLQKQTIRQLWMGGPQKVESNDGTKFIDSKHLYINHMDPLETVTTLFHRKIGEIGNETESLIGASLCAWPDRAVAKPEDMFLQNAVYPGMLAFAERTWRGGGKSTWTCNILPKNDVDYSAFVDFEKRIRFHKKKYFKNKPFPYTQQIGTNWELLGAFDNGGDLDKKFDVENHPFAKQFKTVKTVEGGTVILRHWWNSFIKGAIDTPKNNTTWYARTKIWSDKATIQDFWIGFNDLSRSYASDSPQSGTWDDRKSKVWVNQTLINPPQWQQAGMIGDLEKPLIDEGYAYRTPTKIALKKGWNTVLIKLPVKNFNGKNWQNPEKWMFTFTPID